MHSSVLSFIYSCIHSIVHCAINWFIHISRIWVFQNLVCCKFESSPTTLGSTSCEILTVRAYFIYPPLITHPQVKLPVRLRQFREWCVRYLFRRSLTALFFASVLPLQKPFVCSFESSFDPHCLRFIDNANYFWYNFSEPISYTDFH